VRCLLIELRYAYTGLLTESTTVVIIWSSSSYASKQTLNYIPTPCKSLGQKLQLELISSMSERKLQKYTPVSSTNGEDSAVPVSMSEFRDRVRRAEDDSVVQPLPSRHVDYLSHHWIEEDIWMSWKLIVSKRHAYANTARLENASWRAWKKLKDKLKTVSPESLNWSVTCHCEGIRGHC
jgi:hypothetical protein